MLLWGDPGEGEKLWGATTGCHAMLCLKHCLVEQGQLPASFTLVLLQCGMGSPFLTSDGFLPWNWGFERGAASQLDSNPSVSSCDCAAVSLCIWTYKPCPVKLKPADPPSKAGERDSPHCGSLLVATTLPGPPWLLTLAPQAMDQ